ncbi:MAG: FAD:protein FMN transferase [Actinomycetia bacterium]|nr:FAD:protein FMN transferase [Actinomycetes bacterium]
MGSHCRIVAAGLSKDSIEGAADLVRSLDDRWSRFNPSSEISRLNAAGGALTIVSRDTFELIQAAWHGREASKGRFDPTMLGPLCAVGYDRTFEAIAYGPNPQREKPLPSTAPGPLNGTIDLFPEIDAVRIEPGVGFDPGGIGKGMAADIVVEQLISAGASSACAEIGGDVRYGGSPWYGDAWRIDLGHPDDNSTFATIETPAGAVATSCIHGKRWETPRGTVHHLLDPRTGLPTSSDLVSVSVHAATATQAEVACKALLIAGSDEMADLACELAVGGVAVRDDAQVLDLLGRHVGETARLSNPINERVA